MGRSDDHRRGTALISALLLVAVMSALAVALMGDIRFAIHRNVNLDNRDQALWYARGARDFAEARLLDAIDRPRLAFRPDAAWLSGAQEFEIPGGRLVGRISDANNCFDLNSLVVEAEPGRRVIDETQLARFRDLLQAAGAPSGDALIIARESADWIDTDTRPQAGGAEDSTYAFRNPAHRAANTLMAEREELLALNSMTPGLYALIEPLVCVRDGQGEAPLNINTLQLDQAPLLMALFGNELSRAQAEAILLARPSSGFGSAAEFWALEPIRALEPDPALREQVGLDSTYFEIDVHVLYAGAQFRLDEMVAANAGAVRRVSQRYGSF